jgi:glycosyltransferase involved in cell wall biosynthesis
MHDSSIRVIRAIRGLVSTAVYYNGLAMQIGIDISRLSVAARTGTEHYTYELLAALARRDRTNHYMLYCNGVPRGLPPLGPNVVLRRVPLPRLWTHARLSAEILAHPPEVLFVPSHVLPLATPLARHTRAVVTIHDMGYLRFPQAHTRAQRLTLRLTTVWSARVAQRVIAISAATRNDLVRLARVSAEKITVVHHGLSDRFRLTFTTKGEGRRNVSQERVRELVGGNWPYLLYVGTIQPRKNLVRLIEAFAQARHALDDTLRLVIAGRRGWLSEGIARRAAELGIAECVHFAGYVPDEEVPMLLAGALAFVFPSLYEGFGMPVLEAMGCGAPVLTSNTSALPEVAGDAALLVNPEDTGAIAAALTRLATDAGLRDELRQRGYARAAEFTWERCAEETLRVLHA